MAVVRPEFVILGADRLSHSHTAGGAPVASNTRDKFVLHPSLPIAVVHGGLADVGTRDTTAVVADAIGMMRSADQLRVPFVTRHLASVLQGPVRATIEDVRAEVGRGEEPPELLAKAKLDLFVGFVRAGKASLVSVKIADTIDSRLFPVNGGIAFPDHLRTLYTTGRYADEAGLYGQGITNADRLARHVWAAIDRGIQEDARQNGGTNKQAGGGINVIIVEAKGARLHHP
jgi:hypothetical protein